MKKIGKLLGGWTFFTMLGLLFPTVALAQFTVTATITDTPDGQAWANGNYTIVFSPTTSVPSLPAGVSATYSGSMNASGAFSQTLPSASANGASWLFTICPYAAAPCNNTILSVNASIDLSTALSAIAKSPRMQTGPLAFGYSDTEFFPPATPGSGYFNVISNVQRIWNGTAFQNGGQMFNGGTITSPLTISIPATTTQNLLEAQGNIAGGGSGFFLQQINNSLIFFGANQYEGYTPFMGVAPSLVTAVARSAIPGSFLSVYGLNISCATNYPNTACIGGFLQSTGAGELNLSGAFNNLTAPITFNVSGSETVSQSLGTPAILPTTLYSAAGTPLPACAVGIQGETAVVKDATAPSYMGAYTSGGAITAAVICSYNGTTYSWLTH